MRGVKAKRLRRMAEKLTRGMPAERYVASGYGVRHVPYVVDGVVRFHPVRRITLRLDGCTKGQYRKLKEAER